MTRAKPSNNNHNNPNSRNSNNNNNNNSKQAYHDSNEPTKLDYKIANHLRKTLPNKEAMFLGLKRVNYFVGSKAVDELMKSHWADEMFKTRGDAELFMHSLLLKNFFHRAKKNAVNDKKRFKFDMHPIQEFEDGDGHAYVWMYEPTSITAWLLCLGVIGAVIAVCLMPLWPSLLRDTIWYVCMFCLVCLSALLGLTLLRHVVFAIIWSVTFGKVHLWFLPNLTEDMGIIESFWPIYSIETTTSSATTANDASCSGQCPLETASAGDKSIHQD